MALWNKHLSLQNLNKLIVLTNRLFEMVFQRIYNSGCYIHSLSVRCLHERALEIEPAGLCM